MREQIFQSRKRSKVNQKLKLILDYDDIDPRDLYGLYLTNKTIKSDVSELPCIGSFVNEYPDYLALENETWLYHKTTNTCICWFKDDSEFDTIDGIYNAIIYKNKDLLLYYKERYYGVKYFVSVDYSTYGDFDIDIIHHNIKKSIVVYLWLTFECNAIVFPLMMYGNKATFKWCFDHIMAGSNVAVSLKGVMDNENKPLFIKALKHLIDTRKPKALIVYSTAKMESTKEMLKYAYDNNVDVHIIPNTLQIKNLGGK